MQVTMEMRQTATGLREWQELDKAMPHLQGNNILKVPYMDFRIEVDGVEVLSLSSAKLGMLTAEGYRKLCEFLDAVVAFKNGEAARDQMADDFAWLRQKVEQVLAGGHVDAEGTLGLLEALMALSNYDSDELAPQVGRQRVVDAIHALDDELGEVEGLAPRHVRVNAALTIIAALFPKEG